MLLTKKQFFIPVLLSLIVCPFCYNVFFAQPQFGQIFIVYLLATTLFVLQGCGLIFSKKEQFEHSITIVDLILLCSICYFVIYSLFINRLLKDVTLVDLLAYVLIYSTIRNILRKNLFFVVLALFVAVLLQAVYGVFQLAEFFPSHHAKFKLTGNFANPGPYAGYLVSLVPFSVLIIFLVKEKSKHFLKTVHCQYTPSYLQKWSTLIYPTFILFLLIQLVVIIVSNSRAAWLAFFIVVSYLLSLFIQRKRSDGKICFFYSELPQLNRILVKFVIVLFFISVVGGLYFLKRDSADGRLLIWRVSSEIIKDNPVFGVGVNGFKANYMEYQADYFQQKPDSKFSSLADNTLYPFNEFIRIFTEFGLMGFLLVIALGYFIFFTKLTPEAAKETRYSVFVSRAALLAIIVFSFFSYPLSIVPIKLTMLVSLAIISSAQKPLLIYNRAGNKFGRWIRNLSGVIMILTGFVIANKTVTLFRAQRNWRLAETTYKMKAYKHSLNYYDSAFEALQSNGEFLIHYGKALSMANEYNRAIDVLTSAKKILPNSVLYTSLGDCYKMTGDSINAEFSYMHASRMVPNRFYPKYLLAKLYHENGENEKAIEIAKDLLRKEIKVDSKAIQEIKEEMRELILANRNK